MLSSVPAADTAGRCVEGNTGEDYGPVGPPAGAGAIAPHRAPAAASGGAKQGAGPRISGSAHVNERRGPLGGPVAPVQQAASASTARHRQRIMDILVAGNVRE